MEKASKYSTTKFLTLNFNLKKIILSFLDILDQRNIYWYNKYLRKLLPDSPMKINLHTLKKKFSYVFNIKILGLLELNDGFISCWTSEKLELLNFNLKINCLELSLSLPVRCLNGETKPIQQINGNLIYGDGNILIIRDKDFNLIERFRESTFISSICSISEISFAIGLIDKTAKIYTKNLDTNKYEIEEFIYHSNPVTCLLYIPEYDYLLTGSNDTTINVLDLSTHKIIKKLTDHTGYVSSLLLLKSQSFASCCRKGEIKIWSITPEIKCIKTIFAHENCEKNIFINLLEKDLIISRSSEIIKIWDLKNYNCLQTYKEDSSIRRLIITKNDNIITATNDDKVNIWQIKL